MSRRSLFALAVVCFLTSACAISTPFDVGEELDSKTPVVVALTHAKLGQDQEARDRFWDGVVQVRESLEGQPGFVGHSIRRELLGDNAWTMTAWRDEESLARFVQSEAHQRAIASSLDALDLARFARTKTTVGDLPLSWDEALDLLDAQSSGYAQESAHQ